MIKKLPLLDFRCCGDVSQDEESKVRSTLEECYSKLDRWLPERVEVQIFERSDHIAAFMETEKAELGISTLGDEAFICSHDAWRGFPRLLICRERLLMLSPMARLGTLRHEAAHTVLHGGLVYYVFRIPADCLELAQDKDVDLTILQQVLYYCATAVKDFEATRLLLDCGYRECQIALAGVQFSPSDDDEFAWFLAKNNPIARLLFFSGQLKTLLLGWPLEVAGLMHLEKSTDSMLHYMEPEDRKELITSTVSIAKQLGDDTHDNVRLTLRQVLNQLL